MNRILCLCVMLLLGIQWSYSQEPERKHIVKKGESILEIANTYYVTPYDIFQLNPGASDGIKEGMELKIPKSKVNKTEIATPEIQELKKITYKVKSGDTKYSLAKNFGISIDELESQNPQIVPTLIAGQTLTVQTDKAISSPSKPKSTTYVVKTGDTKFSLAEKFGISIEQLESLNPQTKKSLQVGQVLTFDQTKLKESDTNTASSVVNQPTKTVPTQVEQPQKYISYTVKPKETLYGLSQAAEMSIPEFLKLNPSLSNGVKIGEVIKMPAHIQVGGNTTYETDPEYVNPNIKYTDLTKNLDKNQKKKVAFVLPFTKGEFKNLSKSGSTSTADSLTKNNVAFYEGASIALDSLKNLGLLLDYELVTSIKDTDSKSIKAFVKKSDLEDYQLVFLPYFDDQFVTSLDEYLNDSPIVTLTNSNAFQNKSIIESVPSEETQAKVLLKYINSLNANVLVIHDSDRVSNKTLISSELSNPTYFEISGNGLVDNNKLIASLKKDVKNIILLNTNQTKVYLNVTTPLLAESSKNFIQLAVLTQKDLPNEVEVSKMRYKVLNLLYPSLEPSEPNYAERIFELKYKQVFGSTPTLVSKYGFDTTFDTLLRYFQKENQPNMKDVSEHSALKFEYEKNSGENYKNNGVYILKFDSNSDRSKVK
ncbi:LysM peptidoglycan-binding domain-containing protein [Mangrovimonas sp. CR14]|uniref:LysM peptidoglycan-binding domain-containing protein n=1 Tax=Mangrovimonas sp. CR14 TaxID=2706120 RepID=UPI0014249EAD|nr:LysM peptidoglycan-binding domain-containing protein [Mangrovimonas sp. CR14]NIK93347.1 LysM peptidoglycan-binding domain-containing protein [Mangrovimonas sp. CR14]